MYSAGICKQSMGARNREGIGLSYRTARLYSQPELVPWNRFLGSLKVKKFGLCTLYSTVYLSLTLVIAFRFSKNYSDLYWSTYWVDFSWKMGTAEQPLPARPPPLPSFHHYYKSYPLLQLNLVFLTGVGPPAPLHPFICKGSLCLTAGSRNHQEPPPPPLT